MTQFPEMDDPELQQLLELEAAERGEAAFGAAHTDGEAEFLAEVAAVDPELARLMAMDANQNRQSIQPPDPKPRRWRRNR
ncbi:MAG TPA: hypothetical protein VFI65_06100 [Streptosporangiaceae bacterium]|nr:hypothetical protein [Streptosporangiaceae bacterium]